MKTFTAVAFAVLPSLAQLLPRPKPVGPGDSCPHGYTADRCNIAGAMPA